mgnify:CR=1 FL=1
MKTFDIDGKPIEVPDIKVVSSEHPPMFEIEEGEFKGAQFKIYDMKMDPIDDALMWYELDVSEGVSVDKIKPTVDNFILQILHEQVDRMKNGTSDLQCDSNP